MDIRQAIAALKAAHIPFTLYSVDDAYVITQGDTIGHEILDRIALHEEFLPAQAQAVPAEISHWAGLSSACTRALEQAKREYRQWKAGVMIAERNPEGRDKGWKAPAKTDVEDMYRSNAKYREVYEMHNRRIERIAQSVDATMAVVEGLRAKKEIIKYTIWRDPSDGSAQIMI